MNALRMTALVLVVFTFLFLLSAPVTDADGPTGRGVTDAYAALKDRQLEQLDSTRVMMASDLLPIPVTGSSAVTTIVGRSLSATYVALKDRQLEQLDSARVGVALPIPLISERYANLKDAQLLRLDLGQ